MRKSDEVDDMNSCLNQSSDSEPLFVLCARDAHAPVIVRAWAVAYELRKKAQPGGMSRREVAKYVEAMQIAEEMERWRVANR